MCLECVKALRNCWEQLIHLLRNPDGEQAASLLDGYDKVSGAIDRGLDTAEVLVVYVPGGLGETLVKLLRGIKEQADLVVGNRENVKELLKVVAWCERNLKTVDEANPAGAEEEVDALRAALLETRELLAKFSQTTFVQRLFLTSGDKGDFERQSKALTSCFEALLQRLQLLHMMSPPPAVSYSDIESARLRAVVCQLGGRRDVGEALAAVAAEPGKMAALRHCVSLGRQVEVAVLEDAVKRALDPLAEAARQVPLPSHLPPELRLFWVNHFNASTASFDAFCRLVIRHLDKDQLPALVDCVRHRIGDEALKTLRQAADVPPVRPVMTSAAGGTTAAAAAGPAAVAAAGERHVLRAVLQAAVDMDHNGSVSAEEYYQLYCSCLEWATQEGSPSPEDLPACLALLCRHLDPSLLSARERDTRRKLEAALRPAHQSDAAGLLMRFLPGSRGWVFEEYERWLAQGPGDPNHRAFVLYGGPGLGKSTIAAALACKRGVPIRMPDGLEIADGGGGGDVPASSSAVVASYFCKHAEKGRSDPVRLLRNLAYQLALALPPLRPIYLAIPPERLSSLSAADVEEAFDVLLRAPLQEVQAALEARAQPVVIVVDALDEFVPEVSGATGVAAAAGNPLLSLIREHFNDLPNAVRFVLTSRPEPHITRTLDAVFGPVVIAANDPRHLEDLRQLIRRELRGRLALPGGRHGIGDSGGGGGAGNGGGAEPASGGDGAVGGGGGAAEHERAVEMLVAKSEGSFVYLARLLDDLRSKPRWALADLQALPRGLYATFENFFARRVGAPASGNFAAVKRLLQVLLAAQEPPDVTLLAAAWNCGRDPLADQHACQPSPMLTPREAVQEVRKLLSLLGSLYSVQRDRVNVFHKSFHDWLCAQQVDGRPNEYWVDAAPGHAMLAAVLTPLASPAAAREAGLSPSPVLRLVAGTDGGSTTVQAKEAPPLLNTSNGGSSSSVAAALRQYALRYTARHLVQVAADTAGQPTAADRAAGLLDALLRDYGFVLGVFSSGQGHALIRDLQQGLRSLPASVDDSLRWLLTQQHVLVEAASEEDVMHTALWSPLETPAFRRAQERALEAAAARGWQRWRLLCGLGTHRTWQTVSRLTLQTGGACVECVAWSPDGRMLASSAGKHDRLVRLWDAATGQCVATLQGHTASVLCVAWSCDCKILASAGEDRSVRLWDVDSGLCEATLEAPSAVACMAWRPGGSDGQPLACGCKDGRVMLWDVRERRCTETFSLAAEDGPGTPAAEAHSGACTCLAWSPEGGSLACGRADGGVRVWNAEGQGLSPAAQGHGSRVLGLAWSPDGATLASCCCEAVRTWSFSAAHGCALQACVRLAHNSGALWCAALSPDGRALAAGGANGSVMQWDLHEPLAAEGGSRRPGVVMEGHPFLTHAISWSADGRALASGGGGGEGFATICIWDGGPPTPDASRQAVAPSDVGLHDSLTPVMATNGAGQLPGLQGPRSPVLSLAWSPDEAVLACGDFSDTAWLWDLDAGFCAPLRDTHTMSAARLAWSPDGKTLATTTLNSRVVLWDPATRQRAASQLEVDAAVGCLAWSPDGKTLAAGGEFDRVVRMWKMPSGQPLCTLEGEHTWSVDNVAWTPDSRALVSCDGSDTLRLWIREASGPCGDGAWEAASPLQIDGRKLKRVSWSPDGRLLACGSGKDVVLVRWDQDNTRMELAEELPGHTAEVQAVAWSPDGSLLASGGDDRTVRVWDVASRRCVAVLQGHASIVTCVAWCPKRRLLASGSADKTVRVYELLE